MSTDLPNLGLIPADSAVPDAAGHFGLFGGRFVPEALVAALDELAGAYASARTDPQFLAELDHLART
jgi:tryptophan synthase beta chain